MGVQITVIIGWTSLMAWAHTGNPRWFVPLGIASTLIVIDAIIDVYKSGKKS